jgi:hypothetical protein
MRISIHWGILIWHDSEKLRINVWWWISIRNSCSAPKMAFPDSIEIDFNFTPVNAEPSMNSTLRGISID